MYLSGPQIQAFVDAIGKAFMPERFDQLLLGRLDRNRAMISLAGDYQSILFDVVDTANKEGWALKLLEAARASNPGNPHLLSFEESLGLGVIRAEDQANFERIVTERSTFSNVMVFRERLGQLESWVCAIEMPGTAGSGVLVGPDLVLTNYHVIEKILNGEVSPANVCCRFDYKATADGSTVMEGTAVPLAVEWDLVHAPYSHADTVSGGDGWGADELDFAVIRLARKVGEQAIGDKAERDAPKRGWLHLRKTPPALARDDVVFVLQHPRDISQPGAVLKPMQLAAGLVMAFAGNGLRVRHNTRTLPGSSGSPVLNANLEAAALHHAGEPNNRIDYKGEYNQAIPLGEIARFLDARGHAALLAE